MFGNAIDNAVEALQALPVPERELKIIVAYHLNVLNISITNRRNPKYQKAKKRGGGFGLKSIHEIAKKYSGYVIIEDEDIYEYSIRISMIES